MSASAQAKTPPPSGGSRRAALLERASRMASGPRLSGADVDQLRADRSVEARAELAAKFGRQFDELAAGETRSLANAVLELLVKDVERGVRQALVEIIASSANLPPAIANSLARDHIDVASPVLEQSPVLTDDDLMDIVRTHAMQYALSIAAREELSEQLSDTLAELGSVEVARRLVGNAGAELSQRALKQILDDFSDDGEVRERLIKRPAMPYELVDQLVGEIGNRLEWELVQKRRMTAADARQLMKSVRDNATLSIVARDHGEHSVEREMRQRLQDGELAPDEILVHLRNGEIRHVEAGLALLAGIDAERARKLLYGMDKRGIAALCARAGFSVAHYATLRMTLDLAEKGVDNKGRDAQYSASNMQYIQRQYQDMLANPAAIASLVDH